MNDESTNGFSVPEGAQVVYARLEPMEYPIDVCPDCYAERDQLVPAFSYSIDPSSSVFYARDGATGERLRKFETRVTVLSCLACPWSMVKEG